MKIDLGKVLDISQGCLQSRGKLKAVLKDLYPEERRERNVLLAVYDSGIPLTIKKLGKISNVEYGCYVKQIVNDYAIQEPFAIEGLNAWIDALLGPGLYRTFVYNSIIESNHNSVQIDHLNNQNKTIIPSIGKRGDYELTNITSSTVEITQFLGFDEYKIVIPNKIDDQDVIGIGADAFKNCKGIEILIVSEGIEYIESNAFEHCDRLKEVLFPSSLKRLGQSAFSSTKIELIRLPKGIEVIKRGTFSCCRGLKRVILPNGLKEIGPDAFYRCESLQSIEVPSTVTHIWACAFKNCVMLEKVKLYEGLKHISTEAFMNCRALKELTIPRSVDTFGKDVFKGDFLFETDITLYCYSGSKAIAYARNNNIKVMKVEK